MTDNSRGSVCFVDNLEYVVINAKTDGDECCGNGRDGDVLFPVQLSNLQLINAKVTTCSVIDIVDSCEVKLMPAALIS